MPGCGSVTDPQTWFEVLAHELGHLCIPEYTGEPDPWDLSAGSPPGGSTGGLPGHFCVYGVGKCIQNDCFPKLKKK